MRKRKPMYNPFTYWCRRLMCFFGMHDIVINNENPYREFCFYCGKFEEKL